MIIFAVDPGEVTGLFVINADTAEQVLAFEDEPFVVVRAVMTEVNKFAYPNEHLIVAERYTVQSLKQTVQPAAAETIGALRFIARHFRVPFELQSRADKSRTQITPAVHAFHWRTQSDGGHVRDAARHAIIALARHRPNGVPMRMLLARIEAEATPAF